MSFRPKEGAGLRRGREGWNGEDQPVERGEKHLASPSVRKQGGDL